MANEQIVSLYVREEAYVTSRIIPAMLGQLIGRGWAMEEKVEGENMSYDFRKKGQLTAYNVSEAADATISKSTQTKVRITATKSKVYVEPTEETQLIIGSSALEDIATEGAEALAVKYDTDFLANAANFSNSVGTSGADVDADALLLATHILNVNKARGARAYMLSLKQEFSLAKELKDNLAKGFDAAAVGFLSRNANASALKGSLFNIPVFSSAYTDDDATDEFGMLITEFALGVTLAKGGEPYVSIGANPKKGVLEVGISSFWGFGEVSDVCGVKIASGV